MAITKQQPVRSLVITSTFNNLRNEWDRMSNFFTRFSVLDKIMTVPCKSHELSFMHDRFARCTSVYVPRLVHFTKPLKRKCDLKQFFIFNIYYCVIGRFSWKKLIEWRIGDLFTFHICCFNYAPAVFVSVCLFLPTFRRYKLNHAFFKYVL